MDRFFKRKKETPKTKPARLETTTEIAPVAATSSAVCPWDEPAAAAASPAPVASSSAASASASSAAAAAAAVKLSVCPWEQESEPVNPTPAAVEVQTKTNTQRLASTSSDTTSSEVADRMQRNLGIRHQNTVDSGEAGMKRLMPNFTEQRRASVSFTPSRSAEYQFSKQSAATQSPTVASLAGGAAAAGVPGSATGSTNSVSVVTKDPPSNSDAEIEDELNKLSLSERNSESSASELPVMATATTTPTPTPTPPPLTKITPPPEECMPPATLTTTPTPTPTPTPLEPRAESPHSGDLSSSSATGQGCTDIPAGMIKEVQIELISMEQLEVVLTMPTIKVQEPGPNQAASSPEAPQQPTTPSTASAVEAAAEASAAAGGEEEENTEEAQLLMRESSGGDVYDTVPEELSPTTDEYQEGLQFGDGDDFVDTDRYIPPAPTPAPSMAPLAELDLDTVDDDLCEPCCSMDAQEEARKATKLPPPPLPPTEAATSSGEEVRKKRKKRSSDGKKHTSHDDKDKEKEKASTSAQAGDHNPVCPWEDENVPADGTFVKTYATLGYL